MAGRGRGRGASLSFNIGTLGFGAGEALPNSTLQPPPLYPTLQQRPTPLSATEVDEYLLALSQEFRGSIRDSPFYLKATSIKKDIVRYTDRYKQIQKPTTDQWKPNWRLLPAELKPVIKRRASCVGKVNVTVAKQRKAQTNEDVVKKLDSLEEKEKDPTQATVENEEEENEEEEEVDEEVEDDNDYNFDYYNDGGDKYGDDDDGDEGPVY